MGAVLIALFGILCVAVAISKGETVAAIIIGAIAFFLIIGKLTEYRDIKAHHNRNNYWAYGVEPDWKRKQRARQKKKQNAGRRR